MEDPVEGLKDTALISPTDKVISKVKELIISGVLKPGDKLPAERKMALDFGFGRTQVREALHKLEFYGIIKTLPQSGSVINGLDINTLDGLISDVLNLQSYDFAFHRAIAEGSHNPVFKAMLMIVIPDILNIYHRDRICEPNRMVVTEHEQMLMAIKNRNGEKAANLMTQHLKGVLDFAKQKLEQELKVEVQ